MIHSFLRTNATVAVVTLLACSGCVERDEVISIARDGAVTIELEYEGTEEELSRGDVMPSAESGWDVVRSIKEDRDKVKHVLKSKRRFEPGEELPRSFAAQDYPDADLYLDFPTTLRIERRPDGLYFYFRRVYTPRRWGHIQYWQDFFIDDHIKKLGEKPVEELTRDDRLQVVYAFAGVEAFKQLEFANVALGESNPDLPAEYGLIARQALLDVYKQNEYFERILERCERRPEDEQGGCFDEEAEQILGEGYTAFLQSLEGNAGLDRTALTSFEQAYERAQRRYEITDDLGGHGFQVDVRIPGTIIAHNALDDDVEEEDGMSNVLFRFDGKAFRDRSHELIVVSRLDDGPR